MWRYLGLTLLVTGCNDYDLNGVNDPPDAPLDTDIATDTDPATEPATDTDPATEPATDPPVAGEPIAIAGPDQTISPPVCSGNALLCLGATRLNLLDGSASYDPGGLAITAYKWTLVSKPATSHATLLQATNKQPTLMFDVAGGYDLDLTVKNSANIWDSTPDRVHFDAEPSQDFYVQLTWTSGADLDLHLLRHADTNPDELYNNAFDVSYCHKKSDWGVSGTTDDPSLDWDAIEGYGPETTTIQVPTDDLYAVKVIYYGLHGDNSCIDSDSNPSPVPCPASPATVKIFFGGAEIASYSDTLTESSQVWNVATIAWPSQTITPQGFMSMTSRSSCF